MQRKLQWHLLRRSCLGLYDRIRCLVRSDDLRTMLTWEHKTTDKYFLCSHVPQQLDRGVLSTGLHVVQKQCQSAAARSIAADRFFSSLHGIPVDFWLDEVINLVIEVILQDRYGITLCVDVQLGLLQRHTQWLADAQAKRRKERVWSKSSSYSLLPSAVR